MGRRNIITSTVFVVGFFVVLVVIGSLRTSTPSSATVEADRKPTTTTTTEPPPEGVTVVRISNGVFRPANLRIDLDVIQTVKWVNEDDREYNLVSSNKEFDVMLAPGEEFEFDYSTVEPGINRYNALIGFQRIPGSVDSRPAQ
ncbi:MAG: hypothetical protein BMS9Abin17_1187 [Acidimicrobiia bacterium]|nr:MAG: hypothetical protein BMS9Abin17_1187 [Acidimicrobiia bacterium]